MKLTIDASFARNAPKALDQAVGEESDRFRDYIVERKLGGQVVGVRSGSYRNSMAVEKVGQAHRRVGTNLKYGPALEFGARIKPVKGKYLAIPIGKGVTPAGVPRYKSPRDVPGLVFIKPKGKNPLLVKKKSGGGFDVYFVLVRSSIIAARPHMGPAFNEQHKKMTDRVGKRFGELMDL